MKYTHLTRNDDGEIAKEECTKYIAHAERNGKR